MKMLLIMTTMFHQTRQQAPLLEAANRTSLLSLRLSDTERTDVIGVFRKHHLLQCIFDWKFICAGTPKHLLVFSWNHIRLIDPISATISVKKKTQKRPGQYLLVTLHRVMHKLFAIVKHGVYFSTAVTFVLWSALER